MSWIDEYVRSAMADPVKRVELFRVAWILSLIFLAFGYFIIVYIITRGGA